MRPIAGLLPLHRRTGPHGRTTTAQQQRLTGVHRQVRWRGQRGWRALGRRRLSGSRRSCGGHHGHNVFARPPLAPPAAGAKAALISAYHCRAGPLPGPSRCNPAEPRRWLPSAPQPCPGVQSCTAGRKAPCDPHQRRRAGRAPTGPGAGAPAARRCAGTSRPPRNNAQHGRSSGDACALPRGSGRGCTPWTVIAATAACQAETLASCSSPSAHLALGRARRASAQVTLAARHLWEAPPGARGRRGGRADGPWDIALPPSCPSQGCKAEAAGSMAASDNHQLRPLRRAPARASSQP